MDFFIVPTISFGMLYCFFVITHDRAVHSTFQGGQAPDKRVGDPAVSLWSELQARHLSSAEP